MLTSFSKFMSKRKYISKLQGFMSDVSLMVIDSRKRWENLNENRDKIFPWKVQAAMELENQVYLTMRVELHDCYTNISAIKGTKFYKHDELFKIYSDACIQFDRFKSIMIDVKQVREKDIIPEYIITDNAGIQEPGSFYYTLRRDPGFSTEPSHIMACRRTILAYVRANRIAHPKVQLEVA